MFGFKLIGRDSHDTGRSTINRSGLFLKMVLLAVGTASPAIALGGDAIAVSESMDAVTSVVYARGSVSGGVLSLPVDGVTKSIFVSPPEPSVLETIRGAQPKSQLYVSLLGPLVGSIDVKLNSQFHRLTGSLEVVLETGIGGILTGTRTSLDVRPGTTTLENFHGLPAIPVYVNDFLLQGRVNRNQFTCPSDCPAGSSRNTSSFTQSGFTSETYSFPINGQSSTDVALAFPIDYRVTAQQEFARAIADIGFFYSLNVSYSYQYSPHSYQRYAIDALSMQNRNFDQSGFRSESAAMAASLLVALRETSTTTANSNTTLRNAEYFARGLRGGYLRADGNQLGTVVQDILSFQDTVNNAYDILGPLGFTAARNSVKSAVRTITETDAWKAAFGVSDKSPPGGTQENLFGYRLGKADTPISEVIRILNESHQAFTSPPGSNDPVFPTLPFESFEFNGTNYHGRTDIFEFEPTSNNAFIYLDPIAANSFSFAVLDNSVLEVDYRDLLTLGYTDLRISFLSETLGLSRLGYFDFSPYVPDGVSEFLITGDPSAGVSRDPVFGFRFSQTGSSVFFISASDTQIAAIPEPRAYILLLVGLVVTIVVIRCSNSRDATRS